MMMHGIPLIGLDSVGIGDMINSGYNGYKVHIENETLPISENVLLVDQLGDYIIRVLQNSELQQELGKSSRVIYLNQYDEVRMTKKTLEIYN